MPDSGVAPPYRTGSTSSFVLVFGGLEFAAGALEAAGTGLDAIGSWTEYMPPPRDVQFSKLLIPKPSYHCPAAGFKDACVAPLPR